MDNTEVSEILLSKRKTHIMLDGDDKGEYTFTLFECLDILKKFQNIPCELYNNRLAYQIATRHGLSIKDSYTEEELHNGIVKNPNLNFKLSSMGADTVIDKLEAYNLAEVKDDETICMTDSGMEAWKKAIIIMDYEQVGS